MKKLSHFFKYLNPTDLVIVTFCVLLIALNTFFHYRIDSWYLNILWCLLIMVYVFFVANKDYKQPKKIWTHFHLWYLIPLILIFFKILYLMVDPIRGIIYDDLLIKIDRFIFGFDPTIELYKISNPILTEILQIVYGTFFFLPVILGIDLLLTKKNEELNKMTFYVVYGFVLSFIGYILVPAIGPRFTLHDFSMNNFEMPGILITDFLREVVNSGESIPTGTINPHLIVQRDVFPSGHTQMTLIVMILSVKFRSRLKYFLLINGTLLIFATVYLRYHYVVDLLGGAFFMFFTFYSGKIIYSKWMTYRAS